MQRRLAEVLVAHERRFGGHNQVAQRADIHLLEAVPRTHGQLEVRNGRVEDRIVVGEPPGLFLVVVHDLRRFGILEDHPGSRVRGVDRQYALGHGNRIVVMARVVIENGQVQQRVRPDRRMGYTLPV